MKRNTAELKERLIQTGIKEIEGHGIDQLSLRTGLSLNPAVLLTAPLTGILKVRKTI